MSKSRNLTLALMLAATPAFAEPLGLGRDALPEEIAAWDVNVMPDGEGLPEGSGDVMTGEDVYLEHCAVCHGDFAEGLGNWPKLTGGEGTLARKDPVKTIGSYWPYLSTVWDYVHRSMPFGQAQILTADETYAITAYLLYSNYLVEDDFVLSRDNFLDVQMPNAGGFIVDDRPETEYPLFTAEPCMETCKDKVEITMHASVLDVTPDDPSDDGDQAAPAAGEDSSDPQESPPAAEDAATTQQSAAPSAPDPQMVAAGEKVFAKCKACHMVGEGAKNRVGPTLNGVFDRQAGALDGFKYSSAMADSTLVWDDETLHAFLSDPKGTLPKTKMAFPGLKKTEDIDAIIAFLKAHP